MKNLKWLGLGLLMMLLSTGVAFSEDKPSQELVDQGRKLFNEKEGLGVKNACISCHKQAKAIKKTKLAKIAPDKFPAVINKYLTTKSKGKALAPDSQEMKALIAYIETEHSK